jgi:ABC-type dipeptide/oligopeptide/nickel transport system ATPase subunit
VNGEVHVHLEHEVSTSFRCQRAADSLDIDTREKSVHDLTVHVDMESPFNVGLIVGASGSGKTTLAQHLFGPDALRSAADPDRPIIEQFPDSWAYDECVNALSGIGLSSVPCWIRPVFTLSNGQRVRAEAALQLARIGSDIAVLDEWTSVVDRTVAKVMSHAVQKLVRRTDKRIVLLSCHYDIIEWLDPDWLIDCNTATYTDRRSLQRGERKEQLQFELRTCDKSLWRMFSKYHYLSQRLPAGRVYAYGLFLADDPIGFVCFAQYVPPRVQPEIWHCNRAVVHPDYVGFGLGMRLVNLACEHMAKSRGYRIMGKFSNAPFIRVVRRDPCWVVRKMGRQIGEYRNWGKKIERGRGSYRTNVTTVSVEYVGPASVIGQVESDRAEIRSPGIDLSDLRGHPTGGDVNASAI